MFREQKTNANDGYEPSALAVQFACAGLHPSAVQPPHYLLLVYYGALVLLQQFHFDPRVMTLALIVVAAAAAVAAAAVVVVAVAVAAVVAAVAAALQLVRYLYILSSALAAVRPVAAVPDPVAFVGSDPAVAVAGAGVVAYQE